MVGKMHNATAHLHDAKLGLLFNRREISRADSAFQRTCRIPITHGMALGTVVKSQSNRRRLAMASSAHWPTACSSAVSVQIAVRLHSLQIMVHGK